MRPVELSPRLRALADQVPSGARFVDVGTDHGRLPVWLLERNVIETAVATDLRAGPLEAACRTAGRHGLEGRLSLRLGDGLAPVEAGEADVVAIAGMGGETIAGILAEAPWTKAGVTLLLQPMTSGADLRRWLGENGYAIEKETLVKEDKLYLILTVRGGEMLPLTPAEIWAGRQRQGMESPYRGEYLAQLQKRADAVLAGLSRSGREEDRAALQEWQALADGLAEMRKEWDAWQR